MTTGAACDGGLSANVPTCGRSSPGHAALPALASALAVIGVGAFVSLLGDLGPISTHMALHVAIMNVAAPLGAVVLWATAPDSKRALAAALWPATVAQVILLWAWHLPVVHISATASLPLSASLYAILFCVAAVFWCGVLSNAVSRWQAILALLLTGKLSCLLGSLLIFAPRPLYEGPAGGISGHSIHAHAAQFSPLDDQHFAGLIMIAACPASYVLAGVILAAQMMAASAHPVATSYHSTVTR